MAEGTPSKQEVGKDIQVADGLVIRVVRGDSLHEQDMNAQEMPEYMFKRLVENIRQRGALESLPYCHRPGDQGPITIISGHHRVRAAVQAGVEAFPVLIDTHPMARSLVRAKQIAHNRLSGSPNSQLLAEMLRDIDSVDDMMVTGLEDKSLPDPDTGVRLDMPTVEFSWRSVQLLFLPPQFERFEALTDELRSGEYAGVADLDQFEGFSRAVERVGKRANIHSVSATIDYLTRIALAELDKDDGGGSLEGDVDGRG